MTTVRQADPKPAWWSQERQGLRLDLRMQMGSPKNKGVKGFWGHGPEAQ